jgi:hypothetical protein
MFTTCETTSSTVVVQISAAFNLRQQTGKIRFMYGSGIQDKHLFFNGNESSEAGRHWT